MADADGKGEDRGPERSDRPPEVTAEAVAVFLGHSEDEVKVQGDPV